MTEHAAHRRISKRTQKMLADANCVAEETLSTMTTVKAHAAQDSAKAGYGALLHRFYLAQVNLPVMCSACWK